MTNGKLKHAAAKPKAKKPAQGKPATQAKKTLTKPLARSGG